MVGVIDEILGLENDLGCEVSKRNVQDTRIVFEPSGIPGLFSSVSMIGGIAQSESRRGMRQGKKCLSLREDM
jgi:hypothetical protein